VKFGDSLNLLNGHLICLCTVVLTYFISVLSPSKSCLSLLHLFPLDVKFNFFEK
jgi:hypothetical protein